MSNGKTVLVTGGAGYIGSHCVVSLQEAGYEVVALDNFTNSVIGNDNQSMALKRAEKITLKPITFYKCDLLNKDDIDEIFVKVSKLSCSLLFFSNEIDDVYRRCAHNVISFDCYCVLIVVLIQQRSVYALKLLNYCDLVFNVE